ncbi:MAG: DnaB-like helicase C-terminal domain-containing protein, partial [Deltaproteobacteria bacterium]|nr:DnaB-like helicase C-terminal domain-containing protein [Deltaproteobacteria bacterium]
IAFNAAQQGYPVGVFSLEMSKEQLAFRMLCSEARVNSTNLRKGFLPQGEWPVLVATVSRLGDVPIYIDDTPALSIMELRAKARRMKAGQRLAMVVIDYLQLMKGRQGEDSREREISEISRSLKSLAKELDLPVVALSQLNRKVEDRSEKRPQLADLRESGAIEQDADVILFIYRDEVYNKSEDNPNRGKAEVDIGKQRNGPTLKINLAFNGSYTRFDNLSTRTDGGAVSQPEATPEK